MEIILKGLLALVIGIIVGLCIGVIMMGGRL